jgi:uncharacterized protein YlbG (UPF0298 family)
MKISYKKYYCPLCGAESKQQTNHFGEIYSGCKKCGNTILYCKEPEALEIMEARKQVKAVFHTYRFEIDEVTQRLDYEELQKHLKHYFNYKMFDAITIGNSHTQLVEQRKWDGKEITIYDPLLFKGQYVSSIGRVHDWFEFIFPNARVKAGYWLERIEK